MQPDFDRSAAAMVAGTQKAIAAAIAPLLEQNRQLAQRLEILEARPEPVSEVVIIRLLQDEVAKIPPPKDGKDADPEEVAHMIRGAVADAAKLAFEAIPVPQDGTSVTVEDVAPMITAQVEKAVAALPVPRSVTSVVVDRDGNGIHTYSDGSVENIGRIAGRDGKDADMAALERQLRELVDAIPRPKDGRDGFNLEDFDMQPTENPRIIELRFQRGELLHTYELKMPIPLYQGVWKNGTPYEVADIVTWGGSSFIAKGDTAEKPETTDLWQCMVKRGRDGKDGKNAP